MGEERASLLSITGNSRKWHQEASFWYCWPWWHPRLQHLFFNPSYRGGYSPYSYQQAAPSYGGGWNGYGQAAPSYGGWGGFSQYRSGVVGEDENVDASAPAGEKMSARNLDVYGGRYG